MTILPTMYMLVSFEDGSAMVYTHPPKEVRESFFKGVGSHTSVMQYTTAGLIRTSWTTALISDDEVWVQVIFPEDYCCYAMTRTAERLAHIAALEAEALAPDLI